LRLGTASARNGRQLNLNIQLCDV